MLLIVAYALYLLEFENKHEKFNWLFQKHEDKSFMYNTDNTCQLKIRGVCNKWMENQLHSMML